MRMVRRMCNVKVKDRVPSKELWWYNIDTTAKQVVMVWACVAKRRHWLGEEMYGVEYEVEGSKPRGISQRTWKEVVQKDCQARNLNKEDAMDHSRRNNRQQQQPFYGPLSRTTRVRRYQKKHLPTHHPDHHPIFVSFFHLPRSIGSSLFKLRAWQSFCTTSFHVQSRRKKLIKTGWWWVGECFFWYWLIRVVPDKGP